MARTPTTAVLLMLCLCQQFLLKCPALEILSREELYQQALKIRSKPGASYQELQKAVQLLVEATSFNHAEKGRTYPFNSSATPLDSEQIALPNTGTAQIAINVPAGALRELAKAFQDGQGMKHNLQLALELFRQAAEQGDPEAQGQMAWRYAYGLDQPSSWSEDGIYTFGEPKPQEAALHYYFAAAGGDTFSQMALGYRHQYGLSVPKNCWSAAMYYQPVAEQVSDLSTQPGSLPQIERIRLHLQANQGVKADRHKEVVQYYQYSADRGNVDAQTAVGQVLNYGTHGVQRDHEQAMHYFLQAARSGDPDAMAHLGHMHANGFGTARNFEDALMWFNKAAKHGSPNAQYGLGYMYFTAQGVAQDYDRAFKYFSQAAEQGHADAHFYMGIMHMKGLGVRRKSVQRAFSYFTLASHATHLLAMYNTAMMHLGGKGTAKSCKPAVQLLKSMAERGPAAAVLQHAHEHFFKAQYQLALLDYLRAAEMGLEVAQSNAAWMLDRGYSREGVNASSIAFHLYKQSAEQGNINSLLCLGDSYFHGKGVGQDWVRAAALYYEAYQERSAEAMFNLGFMHEFGLGVPKDLKLAKRFFNMAKHTQADARVPVYVANTWLMVHEVWEFVRPYLPARWDHVWNKVFALHPPHTSMFGPWVKTIQALLPNQFMLHAEVMFWRWVDGFGMSSLANLVDAQEATESVLLVGLLLVLFFVMRVRRRRAVQRQQQQQQADQLFGQAFTGVRQVNVAGLQGGRLDGDAVPEHLQ